VNSLQEQGESPPNPTSGVDTTDIATVALIQQRASVNIKATLQIHNKLLSAYKYIMDMAI